MNIQKFNLLIITDETAAAEAAEELKGSSRFEIIRREKASLTPEYLACVHEGDGGGDTGAAGTFKEICGEETCCARDMPAGYGEPGPCSGPALTGGPLALRPADIIICGSGQLREAARLIPESVSPGRTAYGNVSLIVIPEGKNVPDRGILGGADGADEKFRRTGTEVCRLGSASAEAILAAVWHHVASRDRGPLTRYQEPRSAVCAYLLKAGFSPRLSGYGYLLEAAGIVSSDNDCRGLVTKLLYPKLAKMHGRSPETVERSIRFAVEAAWQTGKLREFCAPGAGGGALRPTNSEIIFRLAEIAAEENRRQTACEA